MDNGYVLLHRKLFSNKLWLSEKFTKAQAWIDLFANANHASGSFWIRGNEVKIKRGQIGWSIENMAQRWRWNRKTVMRFMDGLERGHQIGQQRTSLTTIITIINYDKYQKIGTPERTPNGTPDGTPDGTQTMNVKEELKKREREPTHQTDLFFSKDGPYNELLEEFAMGRDRALIEREMDKFILYWTETNTTGTKQRWQMQPVFDVKRRLFTWMSKINSFTKDTKQRIVLS